MSKPLTAEFDPATECVIVRDGNQVIGSRKPWTRKPKATAKQHKAMRETFRAIRDKYRSDTDKK